MVQAAFGVFTLTVSIPMERALIWLAAATDLEFRLTKLSDQGTDEWRHREGKINIL